jgi:hypothetical protein
MDFLAYLVVWLNVATNALGTFVLAPIATLPGWLSATLVAAPTGILLLVVFKYTSHQRAIRAVRNDINAHLLALKLFRESASVTLRAQGRVFLGALELLVLAIVPLLIMLVPVSLLLAQLALWFQTRPLQVGEEASLVLTLNPGAEALLSKVYLEPTDAVEVVGPAHVLSKREVVWRITAREDGYHQLVANVGGQSIDKELAVGDGFMRVSTQRPTWSWWDALWDPAEEPFGRGSPVQSIEIEYAKRSPWATTEFLGMPWWVLYWFIVSMIAALLFRKVLKVNL